MLELGVGADLLRAAGWLYLFVMAIGVGLAIWLPERWWLKAVAPILVLGLFTYWPVKNYYEAKEQIAAAKAKQEEAHALFLERCKSAGEKIYKTVENVEGILIMKIPSKDGKPEDANWEDAAMARSLGDNYIKDFLFIEYWLPENTYKVGERGEIADLRPGRKGISVNGYKWVEAIDEADGKRYRYTLNPDPKAPYKERLIKAISDGPAPRYGVTYEAIADPEGRNVWIAGAQIKVIDTRTKDVVAQQTRYLFDRGMGSRGGFRSPWEWAGSNGPWCGYDKPKARYFVDQVLKSKQGE